jgi:anti-sigma regulatory factor (Ser/Thr protein kinase)
MIRSAVAAAFSARAVVPATDRAPLAARRLVSTLLIAWGLPEQVEITELLASELVSNAVRFAAAAGDLELELSTNGSVIRLSIADGSPAPAELKTRPDQGSGNLGLQLVDRVAISWGVQDYLLGKRVWAHLPIGSDHPGRSSQAG